jgi:tetratricopeptide (TPR) repeat protein
MKIIRYILSHGLLLGFLVAIGFAYYYRTQLFSDTINQRIDGALATAVSAAKDVAEVFGYEKQQVSAVQVTESSEPASDDISITLQETNSETQEAVVASSETTDAVNEPEVGPETQTQSAEDDTATEDNSAITAETTDDRPQGDEPVMPLVIDDATTDAQPGEEENIVDSDKQAAASSQAQLINQARMAFQSGDIKTSISLYQQLGDLDPANPNVFGELGNIYYSQGKWKQAGEAYYQAASLLLDQGQVKQVNYLFRVIQGLDQESARKLEEKLTQ